MLISSGKLGILWNLPSLWKITMQVMYEWMIFHWKIAEYCKLCKLHSSSGFLKTSNSQMYQKSSKIVISNCVDHIQMIQVLKFIIAPKVEHQNMISLGPTFAVPQQNSVRNAWGSTCWGAVGRLLWSPAAHRPRRRGAVASRWPRWRPASWPAWPQRKNGTGYMDYIWIIYMDYMDYI